MKIILALLLSSTVFASVDKKHVTFQYVFKNKLLIVHTQNDSYPEALEEGAKKCFNFFSEGKKLTEEEGLDIIDVCANPR